MAWASVLILSACLAAAAPAPSDTAPLSDEELALLAALTTTSSDGASMLTPDVIPGARVRQTLARNLARALDALPLLFRTYRGRGRLVLVRDGVRLPATHGFDRLQDGWLGLDPNAVGRLWWESATGTEGPATVLAIDGPDAAAAGWSMDLRAVARSADRGLGALARLGYRNARHALTAGARYESLPTIRLQSEDGAEDGDRLGSVWSAFVRARPWSPAVTLGLDWQRREGSRIGGPRAQRQAHVEHGLAFARVEGDWGQVVAAYLRDSVAGDVVRSTDRGQLRAEGGLSLGDEWTLGWGAFGQLDRQRFGASRGDSVRAEPWLSAAYHHRRLEVEATGRLVWGRVSSSVHPTIDDTQPTFHILALGPVAGGLGWRVATQRGAYLPQPWNLPFGGTARSMETSWSVEAGPTWESRRAWVRLTAFAQRIERFWPRAAVAASAQGEAALDVLGAEAEVTVHPWRGLQVQLVAGWAEDRLEDPDLEAVRPASGHVRGLISARYDFPARAAFIETHARWLTAALDLRDRAGPVLAPGAPLRVGLTGGLALGAGLSVGLSVENVMDEPYDAPLIDRDQVGLDARLSLTFTAP